MDQVFNVKWPDVFVTFMETFSFINLDISSLLGGAIDPCSFNVPFLYGFAIHMAMLPGFIFALCMAYYLRGYAMHAFALVGRCPCCKWKICGRCHQFFSSGAGKNTAIFRIAKADDENTKAAISKAEALYINLIEKCQKNIVTTQEKIQVNDKSVAEIEKELSNLPPSEKKQEEEKKEVAAAIAPPPPTFASPSEVKRAGVEAKLTQAKKKADQLQADLQKKNTSLLDAQEQQKNDLKGLSAARHEAVENMKDAMMLHEDLKKETKLAKGRLVKWTNMFIFFIFPGITMKTFLALRCRTILDSEYLSKDLTQRCWEGDHGEWGVVLALVSIAIYVVGVPFFTWLSLWCHRKGMHDKHHPKYHLINRRYGNLFQQYVPVVLVLAFLFCRLFSS